MEELVKVDDSGAVVSVSSGVSLSDFADRWIRYLDVAPRSVQTYSTNLKQFLLWLAKNGITQPTREDIIAFRDFLKAASLSPSTIHGYLVSIRQFFQFLEVSGVYRNIALHIKSPKIDRGHKKGYLTSTQAKELLSTCDEPDNTEKSLRDKAILAICLSTGLRTISIINADIQDIGTVGDFTVLYYKGKGHAEKNVWVRLTPPVENTVRKYLHVRGAVKETDPLFASISNRDRGNRLTTRSLRRMIKTRLKRLGLEKRVSAHSLRHTAATLNLLAGGTLEETQQLLGHQALETTLIYSHHLSRIQNKSEERISNLIFS